MYLPSLGCQDAGGGPHYFQLPHCRLLPNFHPSIPRIPCSVFHLHPPLHLHHSVHHEVVLVVAVDVHLVLPVPALQPVAHRLPARTLLSSPSCCTCTSQCRAMLFNGSGCGLYAQAGLVIKIRSGDDHMTMSVKRFVTTIRAKKKRKKKKKKKKKKKNQRTTRTERI